MTVVDSHQHFWDLDLRPYDWMPEGSPIRVNYGPDELRPLIAEAGVEAVIQPGGSMRDKETIAAANEHGIVMAFSGIRAFKH